MSFLYSFGNTFHTHSTSNEGNEDFPFFSDPPFFNNSHTHDSSNPFEEHEPLPSSSSLDPFSPSFFSFSPPKENLNLYQTFEGSEVKSEESSQMGNNVDYNYNHQILPHSYSGVENVSKYMQRSFSSNSFERKPGFLFQPHHHPLMDSPQFQRSDISSPEISFFTGQMRKVCSTGDLQLIDQNMKGNQMSPTEQNLEVGRYSAEERKERISKYRAKRNQRNFNKTIKYACRKTLADNRPRIRGRFARNDEPNESIKPQCPNRDEYEVDFWMEELRLHEEQEDVRVGAAEQYLKNFGASQFQYCGF